MNLNRLQAYSLGAAQQVNTTPRETVESKQDDNKQTVQYEQKDPQAVLNSLDLMGKQNFVGIPQAIDPTKYLSQERIAEIEASMAVFESGVEEQAELLENEFGHLAPFANMSEADKLGMAAQSWEAAQE